MKAMKHPISNPQSIRSGSATPTPGARAFAHVLPARPSLPRRKQSQPTRTYIVHVAASSSYRSAGPSTEKPDYTSIDANPANQLFTRLFRSKLVAAVGTDSRLSGYDAVIDLTRKLHAKYRDPAQLQDKTREVLK